MKQVILIISVLMMSAAVKAQVSDKHASAESRTRYSIAWGLFRSKNYGKSRSQSGEIDKPKVVATASGPVTHKKDEEMKSILWGAVKWTEKKKVDPAKNNGNGN